MTIVNRDSAMEMTEIVNYVVDKCRSIDSISTIVHNMNLTLDEDDQESIVEEVMDLLIDQLEDFTLSITDEESADYVCVAHEYICDYHDEWGEEEKQDWASENWADFVTYDDMFEAMMEVE